MHASFERGCLIDTVCHGERVRLLRRLVYQCLLKCPYLDRFSARDLRVLILVGGNEHGVFTGDEGRKPELPFRACHG